MKMDNRTIEEKTLDMIADSLGVLSEAQKACKTVIDKQVVKTDKTSMFILDSINRVIDNLNWLKMQINA